MVSEGEIVVAQLPQADGSEKMRPVLLLRRLPGFGDYLVCGVSTQLRHAIDGFDVVLDETSAEFNRTGLKTSSLIRLTFLSVVPADRMTRRLGRVEPEVLELLQSNLADHLVADHEA